MMTMKRCSLALAAAIAGAALYGCSSDESEGGTGGAGGVTIDIGTGATAASTNKTDGGVVNCEITIGAGDCVGEQYVAESLPLDIYVMFDQSGSMSRNMDGTKYAEDVEVCGAVANRETTEPSRIAAVREATEQFLQDPKSAGIGVGIGYFGYHCLGQTSCDPADYATPSVPIASLPGNAQALMDSLKAVIPTGETPTGPAIRGACQYTGTFKQQNPGHVVVILLVTDGEPKTPSTKTEACSEITVQDAYNAAVECAATGVKTYVLGVGPSLANLNAIAEGGETSKAYLVEGGDASAQILSALNAIRGDAIPCELSIPPPPEGQTLEPNTVNVVYANAACEAQPIYKVEGDEVSSEPPACDPESGGWYYDDASNPKTVVLCEKSCKDIAVPGGQLLFSVGCATVVK